MNASTDTHRFRSTLARAATTGRAAADRLAWLSPTLARVTLGTVFLRSGWGKLHSLDQVTQFFASIGIPAPGFNALFASSTELVCGALLIAGLATRLAAVPLIVTMAVAIRTALWSQFQGVTGLLGLLEFSYIVLLV